MDSKLKWEIRNETKLGGLGLKTARQPATRWGRAGEKPWNSCGPAHLQPTAERRAAETFLLSATTWRAWGQINFCKTQPPTWPFYQGENLLFYWFQMAQWIFWVYKLNYKSSTKLVARSVQHLSLLPVRMQIQYHCGHSTSFWKYHWALESCSSREGKVNNMQA